MKHIETLAEYKKEMKCFVRGVIKSKIFNSADGSVNFTICKNDVEADHVITMAVNSECNTASFVVTVSTRVFNKVTPDLFCKIIEQFNKLKGFAGMTVKF